jgi:hypothetical protein
MPACALTLTRIYSSSVHFTKCNYALIPSCATWLSNDSGPFSDSHLTYCHVYGVIIDGVWVGNWVY